MEPFTTYAKNCDFSMAFSDFWGTSFDNKDALGLRLTLLMVEEGQGLAMINGYAVPYIAPCIFALNETEHCVIPESDGSKLKAVLFHPSVLNSILDFENIREMPNDLPFTVLQDTDMIQFFINRQNDFMGRFNLGPIAGKKFAGLFGDIHNQIMNQSADNWPCRSRSYIMALVFMLYNQYHEGLFESEAHVELIQVDFHPILLYVYHNYDKRISVTDITKQFNMSRTTLSKLFQQNLGESFLSYLNKLRINMAATMLRDTLLPVSEVMYRVGFSDQAHFLRTFKKITNMTPTTYRETYNWM